MISLFFRYRLLCVLVLQISIPCWANLTPLTLNEIIEKAKTQSPDRASLIAQHESMSAKARRALSPASPSLGVVFGNRSLAFSDGSSSFQSYQIQQILGFPGKAISDSKSIRLDSEAVNFDLSAKDREVTRNVKVAFFQVWLARQKLTLNDLRKDSFEKILAIAKRRLVKNTTTEVEYLSTEVTLRSTVNERADFEALEKSHRATLNVLLGEKAEAPLEIEAPPLPPLPFKPARPVLRESLLAKNPSVKASETRLLASESRLTGAKLSALPDFTLSAGINNNPTSYTAGVQFTIPIWFFFNEREGIRGAEQDRTVRNAEIESLKRTLYQSLEDRLSLLEALETKLNNYKTNLIPISEKASKLALKNYGFGKVDYPTLIGATNAWVNSKIEYESILTDYLMGLAELEQTVAEEIR